MTSLFIVLFCNIYLISVFCAFIEALISVDFFERRIEEVFVELEMPIVRWQMEACVAIMVIIVVLVPVVNTACVLNGIDAIPGR